MITVDHLISEAETWIGTPVRDVGSIKQEKCNCVGMCGGVARDLGLEKIWQAFKIYDGHRLPPQPFFLIRGLRKNLKKVVGRKWQRGDLLLINTKNGRPDATHVALCTGFNSMINPSGKRVHSRAINKDVKIIEWYEIPGVKYD
jgi:cell wall-associated NlpC family hydrolase